MRGFYRIGRCATAVLALLLCVSLISAAATAAAARDGTSTVAGWVDVKAEVAPYVVLRVVDISTGAVVRSASLDATHTFSFAGIVPAAVSVEAVVQLPDHLFELDNAASVLRSSAASGLQLKVVATSKGPAAAPAKGAVQGTGSSLGSAALALTALLMAWYCRHRIVSALELPTFKPPKQRKMMVAM